MTEYHPAMNVDGVQAVQEDAKIAEHEQAAHQKRNWVRLTYACNDRCIFCLDAHTHDGEMRDPEEVKRQILDGRKKGAERLILSGGEPTIHPRFVEFVKLGRLAGYARVQTVTNGRMFKYREFLTRAIDAGLGEITFSIHGPNAKVHDALVGVRGAFDEEVEGLRNALEDGRVIVNIDVVINRGNVKHLPAILETFVGMGVKEYDLLQVIPFGRAFVEGRDTLFYDLEEARPYLQEAFAWSRKPGMHIWLNRFPPPHCEGFEELIQDPYKLNDEVRGRKEEYARWIDEGVALDCREPARCKYCYLEPLCDGFERVLGTLGGAPFSRVRVDVEWNAAQAKVPELAGDPASTRRKRLPLLAGESGPGQARVEYVRAEELARRVGAREIEVVAGDLRAVLPVLARFGGASDVVLELDRYDGLAEALDGAGRIGGTHRLVAARARTVEQAEALLAIDAAFEVDVALTRATEAWLEALDDARATRITVHQPTWERVTEARDESVDLRAFFARFRSEVPVTGVPACILGRPPREEPPTLDTAMLTDPGRPDIFRYTKRWIRTGYYTKSLRCQPCPHAPTCRGIHINQARAHGYAILGDTLPPAK